MHIDVILAAPIVFVSIMATASMVLDALKTKENGKTIFLFSIYVLMATFLLSALTFSPSSHFGLVALLSKFGLAPAPETLHVSGMLTVFNGMVGVGGYGCFFDMIFTLGGIMTILAARPFLESEKLEHSEFYTLILFAVAGMMLISHATNMLTLFIGIEVMSVSFYILSGYTRTNEKAVESSLKYFLLGAFATGFLVYGIALIYGATGSMDYATIASATHGDIRFPTLLLVGIGLMIVGLSFKTALFPFHQWAPDVYSGAPTVVTAFMSTAGKAAALAAFMPIIMVSLPAAMSYDGSNKIQMMLAVISALTMLIGNISALVQKDVKRMLAFSSVAHAGYLLMGLVAANPEGRNGIMFYSASYLFMQIGSFIILSVLERSGQTNHSLESFNGLSKKYPILAALMSIFMFSLAGIPPFAGFFGKYYLFTAAIHADFTWLTIVAVVSSIISVYFYIGLIVNMYFKESQEQEHESQPGLAAISLVLSTAGIIILGLLPSVVLSIAQASFGNH